MRGQIFSSDLLAGLLIFVALISFLLLVGTDITASEARHRERTTMETGAFQILATLVRTPGLPENWDEHPGTEYASDNNTAGLWHLNESSGSTASDASGNSNTGTVTNNGVVASGEWVAGRFATNALRFDTPVVSQPDKIEIPAGSGSSLDIHGSLTLEAWINPDSVSGVQGIITRNFHSALWLTSGKVKFGVDGFSGFVSIESQASVKAGEWTHVAGVYDSQKGQLRIYMNGNLDTSGSGSVSTWYANSNPVVIGNSRYAQLGADHCCPFDGKIEEVRISRTARTAFNTGDIVVIGLSQDHHNILDMDKVDEFFALGYNNTKDIFGSGYDFQVTFVNSNRILGNAPPASAEDMVLLRRFAVYNGSIEEIEMRVWL